MTWEEWLLIAALLLIGPPAMAVVMKRIRRGR